MDAAAGRHAMTRRLGAPLAAALLLVALSTVISFAMFLARGSGGLLTDLQLNNYFAYRQDLVVAPGFLLFLLLVAFIRPPSPRLPEINARLAALCAAAVFLVAYAGARFLLGGFGLSMDEAMADFDARILAGGTLFAPVAEPWRDMVNALAPTFLFTTGDGSLWSSTYLPGNAAIRALFAWAGDARLASPALAAASVGLVYAVARKLEPDDRGFAGVALLLLVTSSQFLINAMTAYAMTAHLALNLAWLWLVLHDRRWSRVAAVAATFLACGLHQMIFHPLFVAPLLVWLWLGGKRWQVLLYLVAVAVSALFWLNYWSFALAATAPGASAAGLLQVPLADRIEGLVGQAVKPIAAVMAADNLLRLLTWQNPLVWVTGLAAIFSLRRQPPILWCLIAGIAITIAAMQLLMPAQGHGWGYRYLHGLLGSFALVGAYGWKRIRAGAPQDAHRLRNWLAVSAALSLLLLLPLRTWQADGFVRPYAQADAMIARIPADVVIIDHAGRWFANDLVRNDPDLGNRPLRLLAAKLGQREAAWLCARYRVRVLSRSDPELAPLRAMLFRGDAERSARRLRALRGVGCG